MAPRKLIISAALLLCSPLPSGLAGFAGPLPESLVPEREVILLNHGAPVWKLTWDEARKLARAGELNAAIAQYQALLLQKPDLEEARWELARIHLHLSRWDEAAALLELLVEADPARAAYQSSLGRVMLEKGRFERAEDAFRRAHELDHADVAAISALVDVLFRLGRKSEALPFLEQLHQLQPQDLPVHRQLAMLAYDLGLYDKARGLLVPLAERHEATGDILVRTARVLDRLGQTKAATEYWQQVVAGEPGNQEARMRLAEIFEGSGRPQEALPHLLALSRQDGVDPGLALRIGRLYEKIGQPARALPYYETYLQGHADDAEVLRAIVKIQAATGDKDNTLAALERYFRMGKGSGPEDLKLAARLYDAAGRLHEAIPLYRQLIESSPRDQGLLTALASDLLAIGENEGALSIWKHLSKVTDKPLPVYRAMAELLTQLGRDDELIEVLEAIHRLDPADHSCTMRLAKFYLQQGQLARAESLFTELASAGYQSAEFYHLRGLLSAELNRPEAALNDYLAYLRLQPGDARGRLEAARLAGLLGRIGLAQSQLDVLPVTGIEKALVLQENGFFDKALVAYHGLLTTAATTDGGAERVSRQRIWLGQAEVYQAVGLSYEAGQVLREALLADPDRLPYLLALFELALASGAPEEAATWLKGVQDELAMAHKAGNLGEEKLRDWQVGLLEVRSLKGQGEERAAIRKCRQLLAEHPAAPPQPAGERHDLKGEARPAIGLVLASLLLDAGKLNEARHLGQMFREEGFNSLELRVLLQQVDRREQGRYPGSPDPVLAVAEAEADLGDLLYQASLYQQYQDWAMVRQAAQAAARRAPDSLAPRFLLAGASQSAGQTEEALAFYQEIAREYPDNSRAQTEVLKLLYRTGRFDEALALADTILAGRVERPDILLIKARILWIRHNEEESVAIYQAMMQPPVGEVLARQLADHGITLENRPRRTWWNRITFTQGKTPELTEVVMAPGYLLDQGVQSKAVSALAMPLYSRCQWQGLFSRELAARTSVQDRQYNQAAHQYEALIEKGGNTESLLFDLAGIYSRLGRLGEEAALYERLEASSPAFPGLGEAAERNRLKRQPQVALGYGYLEEEGWENHKALERKWGAVSARYSPLSQHELEFNSSRINYQSTNTDQELWAWRTVLTYSGQVVDGLTAAVGVGVEKFDDDLADTGIFSLSMLGKIGDTLKGRVSLARDVTADTIASLRRGIISEEVGAGLTIDFFPRLSLSGDLGYTYFSDNNQKERYSLSSSYIFFFEPTLLQMTFLHEFENMEHGPNPGPPLADGFGLDDHPYYVPHLYWSNRLSLLFRHQLSDDTMGRGIPRYYTLEYAYGYDTKGENLQELRSSFFMELSRNIIMKASAGAIEQPSFRNRELFVSVAYRF